MIWTNIITCIGASLSVQVSAPNTLINNGHGQGIPVHVFLMTDNELNIMREDGFACALSDVNGIISGQCGIVAAGHNIDVNCH